MNVLGILPRIGVIAVQALASANPHLAFVVFQHGEDVVTGKGVDGKLVATIEPEIIFGRIELGYAARFQAKPQSAIFLFLAFVQSKYKVVAYIGPYYIVWRNFGDFLYLTFLVENDLLNAPAQGA